MAAMAGWENMGFFKIQNAIIAKGRVKSFLADGTEVFRRPFGEAVFGYGIQSRIPGLFTQAGKARLRERADE